MNGHAPRNRRAALFLFRLQGLLGFERARRCNSQDRTNLKPTPTHCLPCPAHRRGLHPMGSFQRWWSRPHKDFRYGRSSAGRNLALHFPRGMCGRLRRGRLSPIRLRWGAARPTRWRKTGRCTNLRRSPDVSPTPIWLARRRFGTRSSLVQNRHRTRRRLPRSDSLFH